MKSRIHNIAIMTALMDPSVGLSIKDLQMLNWCRLYLRVFFLSNIATQKGSALTPWAIAGSRSETQTSTWNWPIQQKPPKAAQKLWDAVLKESFGEGTGINVPLGT
jgi:hypothetical protein